MTTLIQFLKRELLPGQCFLCREKADLELSLCRQCLSQLPLNQVSCQRCANPLTIQATSDSSTDKQNNDQSCMHNSALLCGRCLKHHYYFDQVFSPFLYQRQMIKLIHQFKYQEKLFLARTLSRLLLEHITSTAILSHPIPEIIIPIPLYKHRIQKRGFNQSFELAKQIAAQININIDYDYLKRIRATSSQRGLNAKQRKQNIKNAFAIEDRSPYHHIVLIDDIMTTGNTVNEAAKVLKKAGAERVDVWTIARA